MSFGELTCKSSTVSSFGMLTNKSKDLQDTTGVLGRSGGPSVFSGSAPSSPPAPAGCSDIGMG